MSQTHRKGGCRAAIDRMHRIHSLLQNREYPNCSGLAREFEVATRTVKRDIEFLRDRLKLPIEFDGRRNGYFYSKPIAQFPQMPMSEAEVFGLFVASKAIEQCRGTPFQRLLETAFRRLAGRLDETVKFSLGDLDQAISFRPFAPGDADFLAFELLSKAVRERRVVKFNYRNHGAKAVQARQVHPYHLRCAAGDGIRASNSWSCRVARCVSLCASATLRKSKNGSWVSGRTPLPFVRKRCDGAWPPLPLSLLRDTRMKSGPSTG